MPAMPRKRLGTPLSDIKLNAEGLIVQEMSNATRLMLSAKHLENNPYIERLLHVGDPRGERTGACNACSAVHNSLVQCPPYGRGIKSITYHRLSADHLLCTQMCVSKPAPACADTPPAAAPPVRTLLYSLRSLSHPLTFYSAFCHPSPVCSWQEPKFMRRNMSFHIMLMESVRGKMTLDTAMSPQHVLSVAASSMMDKLPQLCSSLSS